ncbi:MAG: LysM peptidoglycan-binding domain-containing protein [Treponema sp.]|nr:LysM peptidoglycan-binding domain-containing protein [Treponema sp.]
MRNLNNKIIAVVIVSLFFAVSAFAQVDQRISNNEFYIESLRLSKLAQEMYEIGDYQASAGFANEAILFAGLSDEYVAEQLIIEAKRLMDLAERNNIADRFPINFNQGKEYYEEAVAAQSEEEWGDAIEAAMNSIEIFAAFEPGRTASASRTGTGTGTGAGTGTGTATGSNRQYIVRTWRVERDCLWNIAGYSWVYGDPFRWRELYEANKSRMPEPDNPDLILPGMVLEIPR